MPRRSNVIIWPRGKAAVSGTLAANA